MTAREKALAAVADQVLAGIREVSLFIERIEVIGGSGRLIAALRERMTAPRPAAGKPDPAVWAEAVDRMVGG